jgi:AAA domain-containing protein
VTFFDTAEAYGPFTNEELTESSPYAGVDIIRGRCRYNPGWTEQQSELDQSNTKLFPRFSVDQVKAALIDAPVVMITGPRQCGKTTLVRGFTSHRYITLDDAMSRCRNHCVT